MDRQASIAAKFYDPLYEMVVFSAPSEAKGDRDFWHINESGNTELTVAQFLKIIDSYEFSRLNFLKQAGLAWLVFPSATHSRFAHSLGCWLLSDWASENVFVREPRPSGKDKSESLVRLGTRLKDLHWSEEFKLALLLHDLGHFPFSHVIENNDILRKRYADQDDTKGVDLHHEDIGVALMLGSSPVFDLFHEYTVRYTGQDIEPDRFLSNCLKECESVNPRSIAYLLTHQKFDPPNKLSRIDSALVDGLRELISGVIDLDRLDHYQRDAHFISIGVGEFNIRGLLHHMALVYDSNSQKTRVQLFAEGVEHAFQMLYSKRMLNHSVFQNAGNMGYEVMLNSAINHHWDNADEHFRLFLPFYDDSELMVTLMKSPDQTTRRLIQQIRHRRPFNCIGKFFISDNAYGKLGGTTSDRRAAMTERFNSEAKALNVSGDECFLRLDKGFGKSDTETEWMDLREIRGDNGKPLAETEDHGQFVEFIRQQSRVEARTFWIFVSDSTISGSAQVLATSLAGTAGR